MIPAFAIRLAPAAALLALFAAASSPAGEAAEPPPQSGAVFARANAAYENGDFEQARRAYEGLVESGAYAPALFYNLGNAHARLDQPGHALLNYRRALLLDPGHDEARLNASFLRSQLPEIERELTTIQSFFAIWPASAYAIILSLSGWLLAGVCAAGLLARFTTTCVSLSLLAALSLAFGLAGFLAVRPLDPGPDSAMVVARGAKAHYAPATSAGTVAPVPPGTSVRIRNSSPGWTYVELPDRRLGWIPSDTLENILPPRNS